MSLGHLAFAKSFLQWAHRWHLISTREFGFLISSVSTKEKRLIGCDGKEAFINFKMAHRVAKRHPRHGSGSRCAYHCQRCGMYHVGSRMPKAFDRRQRETADPSQWDDHASA